MAERGAGSVVVSTSAWHTGGPGSIPGHGRDDIFGGKTWLKTLGTICIPHELGNHVNVGPVSIWDIKEPLRTSTLAVTTLSANIERSAWCKCSEKD